MKKLITTLTLAGGIFLAGTAFAQTPVATGASGTVQAEPVPLTSIKFMESQHEFGDIKQGDVVEHTFVFENIGENPLILKNVKPTCGCTATDWPREAIAPGEKGEITAKFNSRGKGGKQYKYITVMYNGNPAMERIAFTGNVILPKPKPSPAPEKPQSVQEAPAPAPEK